MPRSIQRKRSHVIAQQTIRGCPAAFRGDDALIRRQPGLMVNGKHIADLAFWVNPGASEWCNTIDDNCDGQIDEGLDSDGDGVCDDLDACPMDDPDDTDGDGVCDVDDLCDGDDALGDVDEAHVTVLCTPRCRSYARVSRMSAICAAASSSSSSRV